MRAVPVGAATCRIPISDIEEARAALRAREPVTLVADIGIAGIGWWRALLRQLHQEFPDRPFEAVLACGPAPGLALAALRAGIKRIEVDADPAMLVKLQAIAVQMGARLEAVDSTGRSAST